MTDTEHKSRQELVTANHILAREGVMDAFGHVSVRHPARAGHFLLSRSRAPELVQPDDILEYDAEANALDGAGQAQYIERFIHSEIYRVRPDVVAICHHHSPSVMPFSVAGVALVPVYQHGAMIGRHVPLWDSREAFGDTNMLVTNGAQGASLATALGAHWMALMRHHGATVVGTSLRELVFRSVVACKNADYQYRAMALGPVAGLTEGEIELAAKVPAAAIDRAWDLWARA
ncbi:class II aldolase/adducin family protein [Hydrogenophaga sp. BPS33]|uniref:class II aldolase/adducin family protein n=1 Tax=Hydrogenophaga sp. BPS33 TaxID=2651974 RepID=UPI00131F9319|nr:class II aldolase/adducin family protein [Hydrogenophaga sp. BPS33]QHE84967.1 class II aldolase/adducin family protein [Hydrogenophaga sp. BPS33]